MERRRIPGWREIKMLWKCEVLKFQFIGMVGCERRRYRRIFEVFEEKWSIAVVYFFYEVILRFVDLKFVVVLRFLNLLILV